MIALFFSSLVSFYLFIVTGTFVAKAAKFQTNFTEKILIGLAVSNTLATYLSLFFPINSYILIASLLLCSFLVYFIRDEIKALFSLIKTKKVVIFCSLPFILIAFIISLGEPRLSDTGLYHLQTIKWIEEYSVVPGLANLHSRFGLNPNIFTFFALTSLSDIFKQEIFSVNFLIFSVLVLYFINKIYSIFEQHGISNIFIFYLVIFFKILNLTINLSSPTPDFISITIPLFILTRILDTADLKENDSLKKNLPVLILCTYALTVKLATLPIMILAILIIIKNKSEIRKLLWILPLLGLIILPWLIRYIILTGWLVYPFASIDLFHFDWKVPLSTVIMEKLSVTGWARSPGEQWHDAALMNIFHWFPIWWHRLILGDKLLFLASIFLPVVAFLGVLIKKIKMDFCKIAVILTSFIGVLFWLMLAPDLRFGKGFIIVAAFSPLLYINFKLKFLWEPFYRPILIFIAIIFILFNYFVIHNTGYNIKRITFENSARIIKPQINEIPGDEVYKTYKIGGFDFFAPTVGAQCFDHALPCTPYPDTTLILRGKTLQSGFRRAPKN